MARYLLSCMALFACLCSLPGCSGGGGEAEFKESAAMTPQEEQEMEDYNKMVEESSKIGE